MNSLERRSWLKGARLLLLLALFAPQDVTPAVAQQTTRECRCVDAQGNAIANCRCLTVPQLRVFGAPRARIGVSLEETVDGARISDVMTGSPAETAGLRTGDLIMRVGGQSLREPLPNAERERAIDDSGDVAVQRLMALAQDWEVGTPVELEIQRGTERQTLRVTPEENPDAGMFAFGPRGQMRVFGNGRGFDFDFDSLMTRDFRFNFDSLTTRPLIMRADSLGRSTMFRFGGSCFGTRGTLAAFQLNCVDGVHLVDLNPELGEYFGVGRGALVSSVEDASSLALRPGDVILSIGGRPVDNAEQAQRILSSYNDNEDVPIRVRRKGEEMDVTGRRR